MAADLLWRPRAVDDLIAIYEFIARDAPDAAERTLTSIEKQATRLRRYPRLGSRRPEIRPSTQILIERPYLILYETYPDSDKGPVGAVEIVRVIDGRRHLSALF